jgi:hypothetical protein
MGIGGRLTADHKPRMATTQEKEPGNKHFLLKSYVHSCSQSVCVKQANLASYGGAGAESAILKLVK